MMAIKWTKATYEMVADVLHLIWCRDTRGYLAKEFADRFYADNKSFDRQKFYKKCGL
jgi:hypothetical protein